MRVSFLGGADEIGASCLLVETASSRILVDCGVRQGARSRDPLPDLARIQDAGPLDAIVVTHAHFDHTGALPVVHAAFPDAPVFMTEPTKHLVQILLRDAIKIMGGRADAEGEVPLYPEVAVDSLLARTTPCPFLEPETMGPVTITFFPAGHILGAAAVGLESPDGRLLVSGDISVTDQLTVPGMLAPRFRADALIVESTYGARLHASREAEERRLVEAVGQTVGQGGKVLIPAFAIGRAQEVLLILKRAMAKRQLAPVPVRVDGMVRAVCEVYAAHPRWATGALKRRIERDGNPFWGSDEWIRPVLKPDERQSIASGPPCCIVASSGMLTGGPSAFYASALARDEKSLIALTGYQDEESPGRRLLELAEGRSKELALGDTMTPVACRVARYTLSAHADSGEIAGLVARIKPKDLVLVHGDPESRTALAGSLASSVRKDIFLPGLGETLTFRYGKPPAARPAALAGASAHLSPDGSSPLSPDLLPSLAARFAGDPPGRTYSLEDLARAILEPGADRTRREELRVLLSHPHSPFEPDRKRPFLFRIVPPGSAVREPGVVERDRDGRLEQNLALARVEAILGPDSGLVRKGADRESWALTLHFDFPAVAAREHATRLEQLAGETGWRVAVHPEANHARLVQVALELAPQGWATPQPPAVRREENAVCVWTDPRVPLDPALSAPAREAFTRRTGWTLIFESSTRECTPPPRELFDGSGRMEINQAFAAIRQGFEGRPHLPRRLSKKSDANGAWIEAAFVSAQVGQRYADLLERLAKRVGWEIRIFARADQQAILQIARELVPASWVLRKNPGLDVARAVVLLGLWVLPPAEEVARVDALLRDATGFGLAAAVS